MPFIEALKLALSAILGTSSVVSDAAGRDLRSGNRDCGGFTSRGSILC